MLQRICHGALTIAATSWKFPHVFRQVSTVVFNVLA